MKASNIDIRDAFFDEVYAIALKDPNVVFLTADQGAFSLNRFKKDLSSQYINVGVAEQNMVSVAAGLALGGKKVFIYTIASFITQRCYEQIKIDLCCMRLPVTIISVGAGITYGSDGPTHHAIQDLAIMRALPEMMILNPSDPVMASMAARIAYKSMAPVYIRIDKGKLPLLYDNDEDFSDGLALLKKGSDLTIIATGVMVQQAFKVADELAKHDIDAGIIDLYRLKPINEDLLLAFIEQPNRIVTLEEHSIIGGIGSAVSEILVDKGKDWPIKRIAIPEKNCVGYGSREWMHTFYDMDVVGITRTILDWYQNDTGSIRNKLGQFSDEASFEVYSELTPDQLAHSLGTTINDIPDSLREFIAKTDFRYKILGGDERNKVILDVLRKIDSDQQVVGAPERHDVWQRGWKENFQDFTSSGYDLDRLVPKFIRGHQPIRLNQNYVIPCNPNFELDYYRVLRHWLFTRYLKEFDAIYEFGCGTGFNLVELAKIYSEKNLYGLDFASSSVELVNKIGEVYHWKITGHLFDMLTPDNSFNMEANSAVFTIGSIEQLAGRFEAFLQFLLKHSPRLCIDVLPAIELYDENNLVDYLAIKLHRKRGYTANYLTRLKELEAQNIIEIVKVQRPFVGSLYMEGYRYVIWKPR